MALSSITPQSGALDFLQRAFGAIPETAGFCLFTLPDRAAARFRVGQIDKAVAWAASNSKQNVYIEAAWAHATYGDRRLSAQDAAGIIGLWADVDVAGDGHAGAKAYPPSKQDALNLLTVDCPLTPTIILDSGHGLQAWWLFQEPWSFDSPDERAQAADLAKRWTDTVRSYAQKHGWTIDSTGDLARLMRLPGTFNVKGEPIPVEVIEVTDRRYQPDDFDAWLVDAAVWPRASITVGAIEIRDDMVPPFEKFMILSEIEPRFKQSWEHDRRGRGGWSTSEYEQSLANFMAQAEWSDQEMAATLYVHRRKWSPSDPKLNRSDYYQRTIATARAAVRQSQGEEILAVSIDEVQKAEESGDVDAVVESRSKLLETVSEQFEVRITRVLRYAGSDPQYRLITESGEVMIGNAAAILNQSKVRAAVVAAAGKVPPTFKAAAWRGVVQALISAAEIEETGPELTDVGAVAAWVDGYLEGWPPIEEAANAISSRRPFLRNSQVMIFLDHLRSWLFNKRHETIETRDIAIRLHAYGARPTKINVAVNAKRTSRTVWQLPNPEPDAPDRGGV